MVQGDGMNTINFDAKFVKPIVEGRKKSTIRKGIKTVNPGKEVSLTSNGEVFGRAIVRRAVVKRVEELREEDAIMDGFSSKEEMIQELKKIYGEIEDKDLITVIYFEFKEG